MHAVEGLFEDVLRRLGEGTILGTVARMQYAARIKFVKRAKPGLFLHPILLIRNLSLPGLGP